ncbi:NAD(P)-binding domain-containing protein [Alkalilimnicola ehrlichii]|uniref:NAD(P)-binding domain-containing protein n=1 Tax=Alkalilimnicola ehrlichii TaxID=351052 RepID=UPI001C6ECBFF|nr:NAD(P)-binding domain-containing protein [Alkalilimnicola ehrlichii]
MSEVTVIGLGEMGSALAGALVRSGLRVTVWNRTPDKAAALVQNGAEQAVTAAAAIAASPLTIVCVSHYAATREILSSDAVRRALDGRTLVQLSTGTPKEARDLSAWVRQQGAAYLDGAILAWPSQIGGPKRQFCIRGRRRAFANRLRN